MPPQHRQEALRALGQAIARLGNGEPLDGLARVQIRALCEYAKGEVEKIQEVKRVRRRTQEQRGTVVLGGELVLAPPPFDDEGSGSSS